MKDFERPFVSVQVADEEAWALIQDVCGASILEPLDADGQRALRSYQGKLPVASEDWFETFS